MRVIIELPGPPIGKGRPRFRVAQSRSGQQFVNAYTPGPTRAQEKAFAQLGRIAMRSKEPLSGPLCAIVTAYFAVPPSWPSKKRDAALAGIVRPHKPDWDNVGKLACDALNGIVFVDDSQIAKAIVEKFYSEKPRTRIEITELAIPLLASE